MPVMRVSAGGTANFNSLIRDQFGGISVMSNSVTVNAKTATAKSSAFSLPAGSHIVDLTLHRISNELATAASDITVQIGTSGVDNFYGTFTAISGGGQSFLRLAPGATGTPASAAAGPNYFNISQANSRVFVKTTAVSGAVTSKDALLSVMYKRK